MIYPGVVTCIRLFFVFALSRFSTGAVHEFPSNFGESSDVFRGNALRGTLCIRVRWKKNNACTFFLINRLNATVYKSKVRHSQGSVQRAV